MNTHMGRLSLGKGFFYIWHSKDNTVMVRTWSQLPGGGVRITRLSCVVCPACAHLPVSTALSVGGVVASITVQSQASLLPLEGCQNNSRSVGQGMFLLFVPQSLMLHNMHSPTLLSLPQIFPPPSFLLFPPPPLLSSYLSSLSTSLRLALEMKQLLL